MGLILNVVHLRPTPDPKRLSSITKTYRDNYNCIVVRGRVTQPVGQCKLPLGPGIGHIP